MIARICGVVAVVIVAPAISASVSAAPFLVTQNFNTNTDTPTSGWQFQNNRLSPDNFGFSPTNNTGSTVQPPLGTATGAGELGGVIARRGAPPTFYGYNVGQITLDQDFEARGVIRTSIKGGGCNLGYFRGASSYGAGGDAVNFVGVFFDDSVDAFAVIYDAAGSRNRSDSPNNLVVNQVHAFRMQYKTNGFNPDTLVVTLDGNVHTHAVAGFSAPNLLPLTHFGILPTSADGSNGFVHLDDLTFTVNPIPEPASSVAVVGFTTFALLRRRSRCRARRDPAGV